MERKKLFNQKITVQWRQGGERCTPVNRSASQTVKKLLQEYSLETWLRDRVPLLYLGDKMVAVGDLWLCQSLNFNKDDVMCRLHWVMDH